MNSFITLIRFLANFQDTSVSHGKIYKNYIHGFHILCIHILLDRPSRISYYTCIKVPAISLVQINDSILITYL